MSTATTPSCPQCGTAFNANDTFCAKCGNRVTPPPPTVGGAANAGTQAGVKLGDGNDLLLDKIRETTAGEYEVRGLLGRGGMASVFVAYDLTLNRKVALKAMHPGLLGDSGMRERFRLEARLAARLDHPNIVTVHAVKERGGIVFFDLKLIDGTSLDQLLRHQRGPLPVKVSRWITAKISDALHYAHGEGVVHRDMKPANVMVERRGDCIVTDFGIAKVTGEVSHLTMTGAVVGTPAYMSPEQCLGTEITAASDQYSLGIMAYELLTGQVPFSGSMLTIQLGHVEKVPPTPRAVNAEVPQEVSDAVMRMIEKDPLRRWPTLQVAADALTEALGATDAQMRRELSVLVHALPEEAGRSLPPTPKSPTPSSSSQFGTQGMVAAVRVEDAATQMVAPIVSSGGVTRTVPTPIYRRKFFPITAVAAGVVIVVAIVSLTSGSDTAAPAVDSAAVADSIVRAQAISDSLLDVSDTNVVRVGVNPVTVSLAMGDSVQLSALAFGPSGESIRRPVRWNSSDTLSVRVGRNGWVYGIKTTKKNDPVFITATAAKKSGVSVVTVR